MKILFLYPNHVGYFRCPVGLTLIMTVCANAGHQVKLFDTTFMNTSTNEDQKQREESGQVKPVTVDNFFTKKTKEQIDEAWLKTIENFRPDLIATTIVEDSYVYCNQLLKIAKDNFNIPIVAGGSMPTVVPQVVIENPNIDYVVETEGEIAFIELLEALKVSREKNKVDVSKVPNLWYKQDGISKKTGLMKYINMDDIPNQRLEFWDDKHFQKAYDGKLYTTGFFEASRGCMHKCHYCINRAFQVFQEESGKARRNKSVDKIINEVKELHEKRNFGLIMWTDDNFLARKPSELDELFSRWEKEIKVPYWINTCIETVNDHNLSQLKSSGCVGIGIGLETGSDWVRQHLLLKGRMDNKFYMEKFGLIAKYKIRVTANNMIGIPGEYEEDFFETIKLNKAIRSLGEDITSFDVTFMAPYMGTVMHNIALEMDLIDSHDEPGFKGMSKANISMRMEPTMRNPVMSREKIMELYYDFADYVSGKKEIPEKFLKTDPERRFADSQEIYDLYQKYLQGPVDPFMVIPKNGIKLKKQENLEPSAGLN